MSEAPSSPEEDARWAEIVANYGTRPDWHQESPVAEAATPTAAFPHEVVEPTAAAEPEWWEREPEGYVPPVPPPLPRTTPVRTMAWALLVAGPLLLVALAVFRVGLPTFVVLALIAGVLASFGYLLWTGSPEPRDPWDDGARV